MSTLRVLLADDHELVRAGLRALLRELPGVEVVGETGDGREAVERVRALRPDVVLMDISMGGLNGLEATARIAAEVPGTRVIILSMHASDEYVRQALRAGASGYLIKNAATAELALALKAVAGGQVYLSPAVARPVVDDYLGARGTGDALAALTARQREILTLIAGGQSTKQIAALLGVSVKTVETHRTQLMDRLAIRDIPGLVRFAIRHGLVSPES